MLIIFEGPDGSGKSTLQDKVCEVMCKYSPAIKVMNNAEWLIPTHPKSNTRVNERELYKQLKRMATCKDTVYLVNRGPISDIIYRIFDDYPTVTTFPKLLDFIVKYQRQIIIVYCNSKIAEQKMLERGDENPIAISRHKEISKIYDLLMGVIGANVRYSLKKFDMAKKNDTNRIISDITYTCYILGL